MASPTPFRTRKMVIYQEEPVSAHTFSIRDTGSSIRSKLEELRGSDLIIDEKIKKANKLLTSILIGAGVLLLISFALIATLGNPAGCAILGIYLAVCLTPVLVHRSILAGQDLENRRIEAALELFRVIGQDIQAKTPCSLDLDFQGYKKHGKLLNKKSQGLFGSLRQFEYADSWMAARGKLHDGNSFSLEIEQSIKLKQKSKRKYTKVNEAISEKVKLAIRIDPRTYANFMTIKETLAAGVTVGDLLIQRVDMVDSTLRICAISPLYRKISGRSTTVTGEGSLITGQKLIGLFMHVYGRLQRCR